MSDRFYGEVTFPEWACKYIPELDRSLDLEINPDGKSAFYEEDEARNGIPWVCDVMDILGIPYDRHSAEYYEYKAESQYTRFRDGGEIDSLIVTDGDDLVAAQDILNMINEGKTLTDLAEWCQTTLDQIAPLSPEIHTISEAEWMTWVNQYKARIFRDNLQRLKSGERDQVGDMYRISADEAQGPLDGMPGIWICQDVACGRIVTDSDLDAAERDFREVMRIFRIGGISRIGAFVFFPENQQKSIADAVLWEIKVRLRQMAGYEEVCDDV